MSDIAQAYTPEEEQAFREQIRAGMLTLLNAYWEDVSPTVSMVEYLAENQEEFIGPLMETVRSGAVSAVKEHEDFAAATIYRNESEKVIRGFFEDKIADARRGPQAANDDHRWTEE